MSRNADQIFTAEVIDEALQVSACDENDVHRILDVIKPHIQAELDDRRELVRTAMGVASRGAAAQNILDDVKGWLETQRNAGTNMAAVDELYRIVLGTNV